MANTKNKKKTKSTKKKTTKKNKAFTCNSQTMLQPGARGDMFPTISGPTMTRGK